MSDFIQIRDRLPRKLGPNAPEDSLSVVITNEQALNISPSEDGLVVSGDNSGEAVRMKVNSNGALAVTNDGDEGILISGKFGNDSRPIRTDTTGGINICGITSDGISTLVKSDSGGAVLVGGYDGTLVKKIKTDVNGVVQIGSAETETAAKANKVDEGGLVLYGSPCKLYDIMAFNVSNTAAFLRLYDTSTNNNLKDEVPLMMFVVPPNGSFTFSFAKGLRISNKIQMRATGNYVMVGADDDMTSLVTPLIVNIGVVAT